MAYFLAIAVYGPVCIDRLFRGKEVLQGLFSQVLLLLRGQFGRGVLFVSQHNPRSVAAHTKKLGHKKLKIFEFNPKQYHLMAFPTMVSACV